MRWSALALGIVQCLLLAGVLYRLDLLRPPYTKHNTITPQAHGITVHVLITTYPLHHATHLPAIQDTWGKRFGLSSLHFFSSEPGPDIIVVPSNDAEEGHGTKTKVFNAWKYMHDHYVDPRLDGVKADWVIKCDDDTFLVYENLMEMLSRRDHRQPLFLGKDVGGVLSGGAGYILSAAAIRAVYPSLDSCLERAKSGEDIEMMRCLGDVGVTPEHVPGMHNANPLMIRTRPKEFGSELHPRPISFHYIDPDWQHVLYYFFYLSSTSE
eukprot:TRINITY_DN13338_c0_g1_i2.p1 TRINITY_DN13338_c0_g1~~TRINITY_DN13338_c0_g1_i2.p1  ORF type:complete len:267 (+),score=47.15 TRINITY_DN13338_c0_g1_i2:1-801(+)